ncbi:MAG: hypothetical protein WB952_25330 [Terriglobales bacterium]
MKTLVRTALILVFGFVTGCNPSPNPALSGTWAFTLTPIDSPSEPIQATAVLTQLGDNVTGQVTLTGSNSSCGSTATMTGTVKGNALALQLTQSQSALSFTGQANVAFTSASGTYSATTGTCLQNVGPGNWSAVLD